MPLRDVKKSIGELKEELTNLPAETTALERALDQAEEVLERYTPESLQKLITVLKREAEELETEHPDVTELINRIMISLSSIGI